MKRVAMDKTYADAANAHQRIAIRFVAVDFVRFEIRRLPSPAAQSNNERADIDGRVNTKTIQSGAQADLHQARGRFKSHSRDDRPVQVERLRRTGRVASGR